MIQVENLSFRYGAQNILLSINLSLKDGQVHVLLGPSGCGKSTFLKILAGLLPPSNGMVSGINDYGFILQEGGLFPHLTIEQNISIQGMEKKWSKEKIQQRIEQLLLLTNFSRNLLARKPQNISGGQRQRVALMRALFLNPEIIFMDEPFSALDPLLKFDILSEMKKLFTELHKTVILVTHDLFEASFLGDTITLLHNGKVDQHNDKKEFLQNPQSNFAKQFIASQKIEI